MMQPLSSTKRYSLAALAFLGLAAAIWRWLPGAITQIGSQNYLPHGFCYLWNPQLLALHVISDSVIFLSYLAIAFSLCWLLYRERRKIPFVWIFVAFGVFIVACGFTHLMDVVVLWTPLYWLAGDIKLVTAIASLITAGALPFLIPRVGALLREAKASSRNEARFMAASESSRDAFWILESVRNAAHEIVDFRFDYVNAAGAELLFGTPDSIQGRLLCADYPSEKNGGFFQKCRHVAETGVALREEFAIHEQAVNASWLNCQILKLGDGVAVTAANITERKEIELKLAESARLEEEFLSHASHELRTPLTAAYFFTANVLDGLFGELNVEQREHLTFALDNVNQLKEMVGDLLSVTRIKTHKLSMAPQHASAARLIDEVLITCQTNAKAKNITLCSTIAPKLPALWVDPPRVRQILTNLVENAIKFTPKDGSITVGNQPFTQGDGFLCLSVSDTGCGISPENMATVFERLAQVKSRSEASRSGLGLGLFIARELVSSHGGQIWGESVVGQGSTFFVTLPVFSLAKLCDGVFTPPNLEAGHVTLISVDVTPVEGASHSDLVQEIRKLLSRCIQAGQHVLLPAMADAEPVTTFFIVACIGAEGAAAISSQIEKELHDFDTLALLKPIITSTALLVPPGQSREEQTEALAVLIEQAAQSHLLARESV